MRRALASIQRSSSWSGMSRRRPRPMIRRSLTTCSSKKSTLTPRVSAASVFESARRRSGEEGSREPPWRSAGFVAMFSKSRERPRHPPTSSSSRCRERSERRTPTAGPFPTDFPTAAAGADNLRRVLGLRPNPGRLQNRQGVATRRLEGSIPSPPREGRSFPRAARVAPGRGRRAREVGTEGEWEAAGRGEAERQEGAGRREEEADAEEPPGEDEDRAREGGGGGQSRRRAHAQGARGTGAQARRQGPLEDGEGRAEARRRAREVTTDATRVA